MKNFRVLFAYACLVLPVFAQTAACCPEQPTRQKQPELFSKLKDEIRAVDENLDGVMAVAVKDLTNGDEFLINGDEIMPQASSIKIAVLAELYHQAQQGKLKLSDQYAFRKEDVVAESELMELLSPGQKVSLREVAAMMVTISDNTAANVLIDRVGMDNVNAMLESQGLHSTRLRRKMMDLKAASEGRENVATPREMMTLLANLYNGKLLQGEYKDDFFRILKIRKKSSMLMGLPDESGIAANKPGELEAVRNDSGVVFAPNRPYVLCVMTTYLHDEKDGAAAIQKLASVTYSYFSRLGAASEYGRVVSTK
jgi:beta-lactamase class A